MAPHTLPEIILRVVEGVASLPPDENRREVLQAVLRPFGVEMRASTAARALALQTVLNRHLNSQYDLDPQDLASASLAASGLLRLANAEADAAEELDRFGLI